MLVAAFVASWVAVLATLTAWYFDARAREAGLRDLINRISTSPRLEMRPAVDTPRPSRVPAYVSDLPYHDGLWDDFTAANEASVSPEDDD